MEKIGACCKSSFKKFLLARLQNLSHERAPVYNPAPILRRKISKFELPLLSIACRASSALPISTEPEPLCCMHPCACCQCCWRRQLGREFYLLAGDKNRELARNDNRNSAPSLKLLKSSNSFVLGVLPGGYVLGGSGRLKDLSVRLRA